MQQVNNPIQEGNNDRKVFIDDSEKLTSDQSSNSYEVLPDASSKFVNNTESETTNGTTISGLIISIRKSRANSDTGPHEVGHSLGLLHFNSGVMTTAGNSPRRSNTIKRRYVKGIIKNAFKPKKGKAKGHINEIGNTPNKFRKGKVRKNE